MNRRVFASDSCVLPLLVLSLARPSFAATFADAEYVTPKDLLNELTEVSVAIHEASGLAEYVSEADVRGYAAEALSNYNIAVRPDSPFRLDVMLGENTSTFTFEDGNTQDVHDVVVQLSVTTRGVVRRGDKLYAIVASPIEYSLEETVIQNNSDRRLFFGDETEADLKEKIAPAIDQLLGAMADNDRVDTTPWYAADWSDSEKAAANAQFESLQHGPIATDQHTAGLDVLPTITAGEPSDVEGCRLPATPYANAWRTAFKERGWTRTSAAAPLDFRYDLICTSVETYNSPDFTRIWLSIELREPNFVFMLNGRPVRKPAVIGFWHEMFILDHKDDDIGDLIDELFDRVEEQVDEIL